MWHLTIYADELCEQLYTPTVGASEEASQYEWKRHWSGDRPCWDINDTTPANPALPPERKNRLNYYFECANPEGVGNGLVHYVYDRKGCLGPRLHRMTESAALLRQLPIDEVHYYPPDANTQSWGEPDPTEWRFAFPTMNLERLRGFLAGGCTPWNSVFARFDRPMDFNYMPDCFDFACRDRPCAGGRLSTDPMSGATPYDGSIKTVTSKYGTSSRAAGGPHLVTSLRRFVMAGVIVAASCLLELPSANAWR